MIKTLFIIVASCFILPITACSAPGVSSIFGSYSHGSAVTITGSDFGTHADYNEGSYTWGAVSPIAAKFKDFEDGSKTSGGWADGYPAQNSIVDGGRITGGKYLKEEYVSAERTQVQFYMSKSTTGTIYSTFWFMMPAETQGGKFIRYYLSEDSSDAPYLSTGCSDRMIRGSDNQGNSDAVVWSSPNSFGNGTWHRVEVLLVYSGSFMTPTVWLDGVFQWTQSTWSTGGTTISPNGHTADYGNMIDEPGEFRCPDNPSYSGSFNYDDIYVSYTQARVELCSGSTWSNKGTCEIQIPITWETTSINISANTGAFSAGNTAYIYVIDADGSANTTGYEVTIGATQQQPQCHSRGTLLL